MAKIPRVFQNQFGLNGSQSNFGQFGSRESTPPGFTTKDPATIQALSAFIQNGWVDAINPGNIAPFLEDMNGIFLLIFYQLTYLFQAGIPEWDTATSYTVASVVRKPNTNEEYGSLTDNNVGNALPNQTSNANWTYLNPPTVAAGIIQDFAGPSVPFGYLNCDGSSYAQASFPALFAAIGSTWNTFNGAASPGAGNFRVPDLRSLTTIGAGQGSGFSNRVLAQLIGEETVTLNLTQIPAHSHTVNDPGHVHHIGTANVLAGSNNARGFSGPNVTDVTLTATTGITLSNTGGGASHDNMQPSAVVLKIIKT